MSPADPGHLSLDTPPTDNPTPLCLACGYDLRGLSEHACPECGRPFDPNNPATFRRRPQPRSGPIKLAAGMLVCALLLTGPALLGTLRSDGWNLVQHFPCICLNALVSPLLCLSAGVTATVHLFRSNTHRALAWAIIAFAVVCPAAGVWLLHLSISAINMI